MGLRGGGGQQVPGGGLCWVHRAGPRGLVPEGLPSHQPLTRSLLADALVRGLTRCNRTPASWSRGLIFTARSFPHHTPRSSPFYNLGPFSTFTELRGHHLEFSNVSVSSQSPPSPSAVTPTRQSLPGPLQRPSAFRLLTLAPAHERGPVTRNPSTRVKSRHTGPRAHAFWAKPAPQPDMGFGVCCLGRVAPGA